LLFYDKEVFLMFIEETPDFFTTDQIAYIYVIHNTGITLVNRMYSPLCKNEDPQLIGGFIGALMTFAKETYQNNSTYCDVVNHQLVKMESTCTNWIFSNQDEYFVLTQLPKESTLNYSKDILNRINFNILNTFITFKEFYDDLGMDTYKDFSYEFRATIDTIVSETLNDAKHNMRMRNMKERILGRLKLG